MDRLGDTLTLSPSADGKPSQKAGQAARAGVRARAARITTDLELLDDIELMTGEAIANAVLHGSGIVEITVAEDSDEEGDWLRVEVRDEGTPAGSLNGHAGRRVDHGRGLGIIEALSARFCLVQDPDCTCLIFWVALKRGHVLDPAKDVPTVGGECGPGPSRRTEGPGLAFP